MTPEEFKEAVAYGKDLAYRRAYESAVWFSEREDLPTWDELTEEQKENIRIETRRYQKEMNDFGKSLSEKFQK